MITSITGRHADGMSLRLSNLDLDGRLVSRGVTVVRPLYGERFRVMRVRMGHCLCMPLDAWGHDRAGVSPRYMVCELLRVVAFTPSCGSYIDQAARP